MTPHFEIVTRHLRDINLLTLSGELDAAAAPHLRSALLEQPAGDTGSTAVELHEVTFVDSAGVSALVSAHQRAHALGRDLLVLYPSRPVRRSLEVMGLTHVFEIVGIDDGAEFGRRVAENVPDSVATSQSILSTEAVLFQQCEVHQRRRESFA